MAVSLPTPGEWADVGLLYARRRSTRFDSTGLQRRLIKRGAGDDFMLHGDLASAADRYDAALLRVSVRPIDALPHCVVSIGIFPFDAR